MIYQNLGGGGGDQPLPPGSYGPVILKKDVANIIRQNSNWKLGFSIDGWLACSSFYYPNLREKLYNCNIVWAGSYTLQLGWAQAY